MLVCDTSGLLAYFDSSDAHCARVSAVIDADPGPFVVSPYVVAELDYLLATRRGVHAELAVLTELSGGAWELPSIDPSDLRDASAVIERYQDQEIGLADASLVLLADRYRTDRILTLDHRHFRVVRTAAGTPFDLLPGAS
ncbi:MAG TPA: PIN domain-containing protein [Acidimicrobiales bacterium]